MHREHFELSSSRGFMCGGIKKGLVTGVDSSCGTGESFTSAMKQEQRRKRESTTRIWGSVQSSTCHHISEAIVLWCVVNESTQWKNLQRNNQQSDRRLTHSTVPPGKPLSVYSKSCGVCHIIGLQFMKCWSCTITYYK